MTRYAPTHTSPEAPRVALDRLAAAMTGKGYRDVHIRGNGTPGVVGTYPCTRATIRLRPGDAIPVCGTSCKCPPEVKARMEADNGQG